MTPGFSTHGFRTGAHPTPRHKLLAAVPHRVRRTPPPQVAMVPKQLSMWGNNQYGDCVSAEEAWAKAAWSVMCGLPELFVPEQTVIDWARAGGFLDGANLSEVMDAMIRKGMVVNGVTYSDGAYTSVDYSNELILQSALAQGPVKLGMDSSALPQGAGNHQGWTAFGGRPQQYRNEDHCTGLGGYGPVAWLAQQLGVSPPSNAPANGYLFFTWSTIGIVDHDWIMSTVGEAWLRNPTTPGQTPAPTPTPTPQPVDWGTV